MKTTSYYREDVLVRRPYLKDEWCERTIRNPVMRVAQPNGRIRFWGYIEEAQKYLRVVTLDDGTTVHNAFFDRNFKRENTQ